MKGCWEWEYSFGSDCFFFVVSKLDINRRKYYTLGATSFLYIYIYIDLFDMIGRTENEKRLRSKNYLNISSINCFNWFNCNFSWCNFLSNYFQGKGGKEFCDVKKIYIFFWSLNIFFNLYGKRLRCFVQLNQICKNLQCKKEEMLGRFLKNWSTNERI